MLLRTVSIIFGVTGLLATAAVAETPLERGTYLVRTIGACGNCHTPKGPGGVPVADKEMAGGFKFVATGHGPVGTAKDITAWREYFEKLQGAVAAGLKSGQTLQQMQGSIKMAEYSHWDGFDWVPLNVLGMYHFLTDSK